MFKYIIKIFQSKHHRNSIIKRFSFPTREADISDINKTISRIKNITIIIKMLIENNNYNQNIFPATFQLCRIIYDLMVGLEYNFSKNGRTSNYFFENLNSTYYTLNTNCPVIIEVMLDEAEDCEFRNTVVDMIHRLIKRMKELELYTLEKVKEFSDRHH